MDLLKKVRDLGMPLISVVRLEPDQADTIQMSDSKLSQANLSTWPKQTREK